METIRIKRPVPLEQREINDTIEKLQSARKSVDNAPAPANCPAHGALAKATSANIEANILNTRLLENVLYMLQNGHGSENYLHYGKLKAGGVVAVLLALVIILGVILKLGVF